MNERNGLQKIIIIASLIVVSIMLVYIFFAKDYIKRTRYEKIFQRLPRAGRMVLKTKDGGHLVLGTIRERTGSNDDICLIKTDAEGKKEWMRSYGGFDTEFRHAVMETSDGNYLLLGNTRSYGAGKADIYLVKVDAKGYLKWETTFGGEENDFGTTVINASDGGYIILGYTDSSVAEEMNIYLLKTDLEGSVKWDERFKGGKNACGSSVIRAGDGGYLIIGGIRGDGTVSSGNVYMRLVKTDAKGKEEWSETFDISKGSFGDSIVKAKDGGYLIIGSYYDFKESANDIFLLKADEAGFEEWSRKYGKSKEMCEARSVIETKDGGYLIYTILWKTVERNKNSFSTTGDFDVYLIKTNAKGDVRWEKTFQGNTGEVDSYIIETDDGYRLTSYKYSVEDNILLTDITKIDGNGNIYGE